MFFFAKKGLLNSFLISSLIYDSSISCLVAHAATGTIFSPWMRKDGKRIRWAGILTRQAKSSCKQACGCISKAVRVAFLTRRSGIEKQPVPSRHYYFPIQEASFSFSSGAICLIGGSLISWRADAGWCVGDT